MRSLKSNPIALSAQRKFQSKRLKQILSNYTPPIMYSHTDDLKRAFIFGKNQFIGALTTNNLESAMFTRAVLKEADPEYLILGNFNNYELSLLRKDKPPLLISSSELFCKNNLSKYLSQVEESQFDPTHQGIFSTQDNIYYEIDDRYRQVWTNDYMTAGLNALDNEEVKVLYGSPSAIITLEDIMLRFSLKQLQDMYFETLEHVRKKYKDQLLYSPRLIDTWIKQLAAQRLKNLLHTKAMKYTAAVFRQCAKRGKSNLLLCNQHFANQIRHFVEKADSNAESIYRNYLNDASHPDHQQYIRILKQSTKEEILKKFYLVSQLVDKSALICLKNGYNVLRESIFSKLIPRSSSSSLFNEISRKCSIYLRSFLDVQTQFIANNLVMTIPRSSKRLLLNQQLQILEDRKVDYPVEYEIHSKKLDQQQELQLEKIENIMEGYLEKNHRLRDLQLLREFRKQQYTQQNIILFTKLLGELKIKTGSKFKLPIHHFKHFSGYFKEVMRDMILQKKYGIKKIEQPQQPLDIEVKNNVSLEEIQKLAQNRKLVNDDQIKEVRMSTDEAIKEWNSLDILKK